MTRAIIKSALAISELEYVLDNISTDDKKKIEDYTDAEILHEAKYVLSLFLDPNETHWNRERYTGKDGEVQFMLARHQVKKIKALIKKYS